METVKRKIKQEAGTCELLVKRFLFPRCRWFGKRSLTIFACLKKKKIRELKTFV